jgi:hypothetical protein
MPRRWGGRFARAAYVVAAIAAVASCRRLAPGSACTTNGAIHCTDAVSGLLCQGGALVALPCRGPRGCQGRGAAATCDDDLALEADVCQETRNENYSCSLDHTRELVCKDGKFQGASTCRGPNKCAITGTTIACDDSMAELGDPCLVEAGDRNFGCSMDKKIEVQCDAATNRFVAYNGCRGPAGCWIGADFVHCDASFAREGDPCQPVDNHACSEDARSEMRCSPQMKWTKHRDCKQDGCRVKGHEIWCD